MRRIALFSDIHANLEALDAVLADIDAQGIAEVYCLGDLVGYGPDPAGVIARIRDLKIPTIQGNYDEGVGNRRGECGCYYATDAARADGAASYAFTDAALSDADATWLAALPERITLDEGPAHVLLVHGSPRKINEYLLPDRTEKQLARLAAAADADAVCHGHVHLAFHRSFVTESGGRVHYVSSGSAGKPKDSDPRASWVELLLGSAEEVTAALSVSTPGSDPGAVGDPAAGPLGHTDVWLGVVVHRVAYDIDAVAAAMLSAGLPNTLVEALRRA